MPGFRWYMWITYKCHAYGEQGFHGSCYHHCYGREEGYWVYDIKMLGTVPNVLHTLIHLFLATVLWGKILSLFITEETKAQGRVSNNFFKVKKLVWGWREGIHSWTQDCLISKSMPYTNYSFLKNIYILKLTIIISSQHFLLPPRKKLK